MIMGRRSLTHANSKNLAAVHALHALLVLLVQNLIAAAKKMMTTDAITKTDAAAKKMMMTNVTTETDAAAEKMMMTDAIETIAETDAAYAIFSVVFVN
jgi:hypothetical protein